MVGCVSPAVLDMTEKVVNSVTMDCCQGKLNVKVVDGVAADSGVVGQDIVVGRVDSGVVVVTDVEFVEAYTELLWTLLRSLVRWI